jgi:hypothetical protein
MVGEMAENLEVWKLGMAFHIYIIIYNIYIYNEYTCVCIYIYGKVKVPNDQQHW